MNTIYDVDYFINKFERIAEQMWRVGDFGYQGIHCALGHCGSTWDKQGPGHYELIGLFKTAGLDVALVNDGISQLYRQPTPKQRILAALRDIKAKQQPKEIVKVMVVDDKPLPERIVYVTVDKEVRELQKAELPLS